ncbi:MAG: CGNR zinc finger domain-containing protein [Gammaproteobacteria bacterium]
MSKKALQSQNEVFLIQSHGNVLVWDFFAEEIVEAANNALANCSACDAPEHQVLHELRAWMNRYLEEGISDEFLNDLNAALHEIRYSKYVLPLDLLPSESGFPRNGYIAKYERTMSPTAVAADDFSKLLTSGMLRRLKLCQSQDCQRFFLGPPQAKWCSKTCGSKFRVRAKRKRDVSRSR